MHDEQSNEPKSKVQIEGLQNEINELNDQRPTPEMELIYTIDGTEEQEVHTEVAEEQNAEIDAAIDERTEEQQRMEAFLNQHQGDLKRDFNQSRE